MKRTSKKYDYKGFIWLLPALLFLLVFSYYPPIRTLMLSFTNAKGTGIGEFVFLDNYIELFKSKVFWVSMRNLIIFLISGLIVGNVMTILLAELLYNLKRKRLSSFLDFYLFYRF